MMCKFAEAKKIVEEKLYKIYKVESHLYNEWGNAIAGYDPDLKIIKFWHPNIIHTYKERDRLDIRISCYEYIVLLFFHEYGHYQDSNSGDFFPTEQQLKDNQQYLELYKYTLKFELSAWEIGREYLKAFLSKNGFDDMKEHLKFEVKSPEEYLDYFDLQNENNFVDYHETLSLNYQLKDPFVQKIKELISDSKFDEIKKCFRSNK